MDISPANTLPADAAGFTAAAWEQVTVEAAATLEVWGKQNRGFLEVTLANNSDQVLAPGVDGEIAFSFKLLDSSGDTCPVEGIRTPLTRLVPPGARHTQKVAIVVPTDYIEAVAAVRVGMVHEGRYWVETICPHHPCTVKITRGGEPDNFDALLAAGSQLWERGKGNGLRWPYGAMMVSERHKLFYIPVAKCACTSLKSMMVKLAGLDNTDVVLELGVHFVTDRFNTGVQLKDKPIELAREILASDRYFKFGVVRDPFERLVSAYLEKFVYKRASKRNLVHTEPVIRDIQGDDRFDPHTGISFDQFAEYIFRQDPYDLDEHWRPQYLYFLGVPHMSRIFRLENIAELERYLRQNLGVGTTLGHANATAKSDLLLAGASELTAAELDDRGSVDPVSFLSSRHADRIRQYYSEDFGFYDAAV